MIAKAKIVRLLKDLPFSDGHNMKKGMLFDVVEQDVDKHEMALIRATIRSKETGQIFGVTPFEAEVCEWWLNEWQPVVIGDPNKGGKEHSIFDNRRTACGRLYTSNSTIGISKLKACRACINRLCLLDFEVKKKRALLFAEKKKEEDDE
jgi:hypothetical protein